MSFADLGLGAEVLRAVDDAGYREPTPIQEKAIPYILMGRDILGGAQTGTGKTASFTLPMIDILAAGRTKARMPRSLILCPTRELAAQVAVNFDTYGKYHPLTKALLIGGVSFADQVKVIDRGADVLIATPGRLLDHFGRGKIMLNDIKILVIDEADRMLDMGFMPDVERIVDLLPRIRQTLFFSATIPPEIRRLADKFLINPKEVFVSPPASVALNVAQHLVPVEARNKAATLRRLLGEEDVRYALIFCNRKRDIGTLTRTLQNAGFNASALHGDMHQEQRTQTLARFKNGEISLLVCSDVAARGLDISTLSHVFCYDVPMNAEDYVHRIGRTGRAGRSGRAFILMTPDETKYIAAIERLIGTKIPRLGAKEGAPAAAEAAPAEKTEPRRPRRRTKSANAESAATAEPKSDPATEAVAPDESKAEAEPEKKAEIAEIAEKTEKATSQRAEGTKSEEPREKKAPPPRGGRQQVLAFGDDVPAFFRQDIMRAR